MIKPINRELSFNDLEQMIDEMEQRSEFTCTSNDGRTCPTGACGVYGTVCSVNGLNH